MTRLTSLLIASALVLASCGSKSKDKATGADSSATQTTGMTTVNTNSQTQNAATDMQKNMEALQKLTPLTMDQLKNVVPEELNGVKRSNYSATSMSGAAYVEARYKMNDTTNIHVAVWDCAGTVGAGVYNAQFGMLYNFQQEDENGYTKTTDFNGTRAVERYQKSNNSYTVTYFAGERYLISLEGTNTSLDALSQASKQLNLK